jgi:hypothetical protein
MDDLDTSNVEDENKLEEIRGEEPEKNKQV